MATADLIQELNTDLLEAYDAIEAKGGEVPVQKNTANLATAIESITGGGGGGSLDGGQYGAVAYLRDGEVRYYTATSSSDLSNLTSTSDYARTIKILDDGFVITNENIVGYAVGSTTTSIPSYFLRKCPLLQKFCWSKEGRISTIGARFLATCPQLSAFDGAPDGVTSIGEYFLSGAQTFNRPITLPNSITSIGSNFMENCSRFNQPITLPNGLSAIDGYFLSGCGGFNQPITIPNSVRSIGNNFMSNATYYNQMITLPNSLTSIGSYFLSSCQDFNQPLTLPSTLTSVGQYFMYNCNQYAQPLALPDSLSSIGNNFMRDAREFTSLNVGQARGFSSDSYTLACTSNVAPMYVQGVALTGENAQTWKNSLSDSNSSPYRKLIVANTPTPELEGRDEPTL